MLAYYLQQNLPDFSVQIVFKGQEEWKEFVDLHFTKNGWNTRMARDGTIKKREGLEQLVWYESGELIGMALERVESFSSL